MNAVAFITDFISKDNTSSLDVFYASVVITACFSNILLHSLVWHNVRAATTAVYYWDCGVTPDLRNTYRFPCSHACLHLRTSLRDPHSADRARNSVFCWSGDCTSRRETSPRHSIETLEHLFFCLQPLGVGGSTVMVPIPLKLEMVLKGTLGHSSWKKHGLVEVVAMSRQFDYMIIMVFSNRSDSMKNETV